MENYMKNKIKNNHFEDVHIFVIENGVEKQVSIAPGDFVIADARETKTIVLFSLRGFISVSPFSESTEGLDSISSLNPSVDNYEENKDDDSNDKGTSVETTQVMELSEPTLENSTKEIAVNMSSDASTLEVVETQVGQYIEGGLVKGEWTDAEVSILKKNYPTKGRKKCSEILNRNELSVQKKITALGLKKKAKK